MHRAIQAQQEDPLAADVYQVQVGGEGRWQTAVLEPQRVFQCKHGFFAQVSGVAAEVDPDKYLSAHSKQERAFPLRSDHPSFPFTKPAIGRPVAKSLALSGESEVAAVRHQAP